LPDFDVNSTSKKHIKRTSMCVIAGESQMVNLHFFLYI